jgi:hypothetical protein
VFGIAGSFLPELTRRIVYDQTAKILRRQLVEHDVVADVSVHVVQAPRATDDAEPTPTTDPAQPVLESFESSAEFLEEAEYLDKVDKVDIVDIVVERPQPPAQ